MTSHAREAERIVSTMPSGDTLDQAYAYAQVHATLALVEQQRIANLVSLADLAGRMFEGYAGDAGPFTTVFDNPRTLHGNVRVKTEIAAALGIGEQP